MIALVAVLLANADGRSGAFLSQLLTLRADRRRVTAIAFAAFAANATVAGLFGSLLNRMIGQGVIALLIAFALVTAAAALLWPGRLGADAAGLAETRPPLLAARLTLDQLGDRSHFLIAALAATSGAAPWAAAGGMVGWVLAMLPWLAFGPDLSTRRWARRARWIAALILILWAARAAMGAFGLIAA